MGATFLATCLVFDEVKGTFSLAGAPIETSATQHSTQRLQNWFLPLAVAATKMLRGISVAGYVTQGNISCNSVATKLRDNLHEKLPIWCKHRWQTSDINAYLKLSFTWRFVYFCIHLQKWRLIPNWSMRLYLIFVTAVCVLFLIKLRWPKKRSIYDSVNTDRLYFHLIEQQLLRRVCRIPNANTSTPRNRHSLCHCFS